MTSIHDDAVVLAAAVISDFNRIPAFAGIHIVLAALLSLSLLLLLAFPLLGAVMILLSSLLISTIYMDYYALLSLLYLVWYQNNIAEPECKARYRIPVDEPLYVLAKHYYLTRTNLLLAYMAKWILLSK